MTDSAPVSRMERQALELLPWYVNGTLAGEEREQVRRVLRSSLTCRLEYERLCRMRDLIQQDDAEHAATYRAFERLMARIEGSGAAPHARGASGQPRPHWLLVARAATLLAVVTGIAWWWSQGPAIERRSYETLTAGEPAPAKAPRLRLVFAAGVTEESRRAIFSELGLTIVAPPMPDGIYTLALPQDADPREIVGALRADPRIAFVTMPPASENR